MVIPLEFQAPLRPDYVATSEDDAFIRSVDVHGALRYRGEYDNTVTDYTYTNLVHTGNMPGLVLFWVVSNPTLANANAPSIASSPLRTGWGLFTGQRYFQGDAPEDSTAYVIGESVHIPTDQSIRLCLADGNYTRAEILESSNWRNLTGGGLVAEYDGTGEPTGEPSDGVRLAIDDNGRVWPIQKHHVTYTSEPTITRTQVSNADWSFWNNVHGGTNHPGSVSNNPGHFYWSSTYHYFYQNNGILVQTTTWSQALQFLAERTPPALPPANLQNRTWLGRFDTHLAAAQALSRRSNRNDRNWIYVKEGGSDEGLYIVTAHTDGGVVISEDQLAYKPNLIDLADAIDNLGVLDGRLEIPVPSPDYEGRLLYNPYTLSLEVCANIPTVSRDAQGDWANIPTRNDLTVVRDRDTADRPSNTGTYILDESDNHFYRYDGVYFGGALYEQVSAGTALAASRSNNTYGVRFLGTFSNDEGALQAITSNIEANRDYFYNRYGDIRRLDASTFVPPVTSRDHYLWIRAEPGEIFTADEKRTLEDLGRVALPHPSDAWHLRQTYPIADFNNGNHVNENIIAVDVNDDDEVVVFTSEGRAAHLNAIGWSRLASGSNRITDAVHTAGYWLWIEQNTIRARIEDASAAEVEVYTGPLNATVLGMFVDEGDNTAVGWFERTDADTVTVYIGEYTAGGTISLTGLTTITRNDMIQAFGAEYNAIRDVYHLERGITDIIWEGDTMYAVMTGMVRSDNSVVVNVLVPFSYTESGSNITITRQGDPVQLAQTSARELQSAILPDSTRMYVATKWNVYELSPQSEAGATLEYAASGGRVDTKFNKLIITGAGVDIHLNGDGVPVIDVHGIPDVVRVTWGAAQNVDGNLNANIDFQDIRGIGNILQNVSSEPISLKRARIGVHPAFVSTPTSESYYMYLAKLTMEDDTTFTQTEDSPIFFLNSANGTIGWEWEGNYRTMTGVPTIGHFSQTEEDYIIDPGGYFYIGAYNYSSGGDQDARTIFALSEDAEVTSSLGENLAFVAKGAHNSRAQGTNYFSDASRIIQMRVEYEIAGATPTLEIENEGELISYAPRALDFDHDFIVRNLEGKATVGLRQDNSRIVDSTYTLDVEGSALDVSNNLIQGIIFQNGSRGMTLKTVSGVSIRSAVSGAEYRVHVAQMDRDSSTAYSVMGAVVTVSAGTFSDELEELNIVLPDFGVQVPAAGYFAVLIEAVGTHSFSVLTGTIFTESSNPFREFSQVARAVAVNLNDGTDIYDAGDSRVEMDIGFTLTVTQHVEARVNGTPLAVAPDFINFRGNLVSGARDGNGVNIDISDTTGGGGRFSRTELTAKNAVSRPLARTFRRFTLSTSLDDMSDDDEIEIILETGGLGFLSDQVHFTVGEIKSRTVTNDADGAAAGTDAFDTTDDVGKYITYVIDRGNADTHEDFGHDIIRIGRVDSTTLVAWTAHANGGYEFATVNRLQFNDDTVSPQGELLLQRTTVAASETLARNPFSLEFDRAARVDNTYQIITELAKDAIEEIYFRFAFNGGAFSHSFTLKREDIDFVGYTNETAWPWSVTSGRIPAAYWAGRVYTDGQIDPVTLRPGGFRANQKRINDDPFTMIFIFFQESGDLFTGVRIDVWSGNTVFLGEIEVLHN